MVDGDLCETFLFLTIEQQNTIVRQIALKLGTRHRDDADTDIYETLRLDIIRILEGLRNQAS